MEAVPILLGMIVAFAAGMLSFLSPCVRPLVPSYLSFVTGMSLEDLQEGVDRRNTMIHASLFVVGFSLVFMLLGATASFLGQFFRLYEVWVPRIGGLIIIVLGLHLMGALKIAPLFRERRMHFNDKPAGYLGTIAVGMAFGAGWTPCLGPVLGGILTLAATTEAFGSGMWLLAAYSAGLGFLLLLSAIVLERFLEAFQRVRRFLPMMQVASGAILILLGLLLITGSFTVLTAYLYQLTPEWLIDWEEWMIEQAS
jgi:cytochrome c-type biogenesis protein